MERFSHVDSQLSPNIFCPPCAGRLGHAASAPVQVGHFRGLGPVLLAGRPRSVSATHHTVSMTPAFREVPMSCRAGAPSSLLFKNVIDSWLFAFPDQF